MTAASFVGANYALCDLSRFTDEYGPVRLAWPAGTQPGDIAYVVVCKASTLTLSSGGEMAGWELLEETGAWPDVGYGARVYQRKVVDVSGYAYEATFYGKNEAYAACWVGRGGQFQRLFSIWNPGTTGGESLSIDVLGGTRVVAISVGASGISGGGDSGFSAPVITRLSATRSDFENGYVSVGDVVLPEPGLLTVSSWHGSSNGNMLAVFLTPGLRRGMPPGRRYPRRDGLATSSAPRVERFRQSRQGSNRHGGTYY